MKKIEQLKQEARDFLIPLIIATPELTIFIKSVSASGMNRKMKVLIGSQDVSYYINDLLEYNHGKGMSPEYIKVNGVGMDMAFRLADAITYQLWPYKYQTGTNTNGQIAGERNKTYLLTTPDAGLLTGNGGGCLEYQTIY